MPIRIPDNELINKQYWRLKITWIWSTRNKRRFVKTSCECWIEKEVNLSDLRLWKVLSCWCLNKEFVKKRATKHWFWNTTRIYTIWKWIKRRCNSDNKNYWWRWIMYTPKWEKFEEFYKDMWPTYKEWLTIDRIDNDWNYCKENCRWTTMKEQANNTRNNRIFEYKWEKLTMSQFCEKYSISYRKLRYRINQLWYTHKQAIKYFIN